MKEKLSKSSTELEDQREQVKQLLNQFKKSEEHKRRLELKVSELTGKLSTMSAKLKSTESRLADMEQDRLILNEEIEKYRAQVNLLHLSVELDA